MKYSFFEASKRDGTFLVDPRISVDVLKMFNSRAKSVNVDLSVVFDRSALAIKEIEKIADTKRKNEDILSVLVALTPHVLDIAILIEFLYPMMEQLETLIHKKIHIQEKGLDDDDGF